MADDDWTFVPRKKQGKAPTVTSTHTPASLKDATLESIGKEFAVKSRAWIRSDARQQLRRTLAHLKPDAGWKIETAVCLGTGSFSRDNFDCRKRTLEQFAMFVDTVEYLHELEGKEIEIYVQEGWYNELDKKFLETLGMKVPDMKPGSYPIPDCGPATKYFGPHTFVCELYIEHNEGTIRTLTQSQAPLLMSTSRRMCTRGFYAGEAFKEGDLIRLLNFIDKEYKTLRFPYFEEDPNVFEGMDVLAPVPREDDD